MRGGFRSEMRWGGREGRRGYAKAGEGRGNRIVLKSLQEVCGLREGMELLTTVKLRARGRAVVERNVWSTREADISKQKDRTGAEDGLTG